MQLRMKALSPVLLIGALGLAGCGGDSSTAPSPARATDVVVKNGEIAASETWTADNQYLIQGALFVRAGATLSIQAGTTIYGDQATTGTLVIDRGAQLVAQG